MERDLVLGTLYEGSDYFGSILAAPDVCKLPSMMVGPKAFMGIVFGTQYPHIRPSTLKVRVELSTQEPELRFPMLWKL